MAIWYTQKKHDQVGFDLNTLSANPTNGQTPSRNSSTKADECLSVSNHFVGLALKALSRWLLVGITRNSEWALS